MKRLHLSRTRSAAVFFALAVANSWGCWAVVIAAQHRYLSLPPGSASTLVLLGTFGPLFSALTMVARPAGFRGVAGLLGQAFRWRIGLKWYVAALVAPAIVRFAVLGIHLLKGGTLPDMDDPARWLAIPATFLMVLILGGPLAEEFGWRGYALPRLQPRTGALSASLVIGVSTAIWHLPLFLIPSTAQSHLPFALFLVRTLALAVISTWLYNGSGKSLLIVLLFHASLNTWPNTLFILEAQGTIGPYISTTILYTGWACLLILLSWVSTGRERVTNVERPAA
ncbi:MAG TPA: type II CAAX endopeptidase family protein [Candidatus Dormibacteraeota bacterium]